MYLERELELSADPSKAGTAQWIPTGRLLWMARAVSMRVKKKYEPEVDNKQSNKNQRWVNLSYVFFILSTSS